jgi:hypothetical protein
MTPLTRPARRASPRRTTPSLTARGDVPSTEVPKPSDKGWGIVIGHFRPKPEPKPEEQRDDDGEARDDCDGEHR